MEQKDNFDFRKLTRDELENAGASDKFISYYLVAKERKEKTMVMKKAVDYVEGIKMDPKGFYGSLWLDEPRKQSDRNPYGAVMHQKEIMEDADIWTGP